MDEKKEAGFFSSLFDLSFKKFITPKLVKFLFVISIIFWGLVGLFIFLEGFKMAKYSDSKASEFISILLGFLVFLIGVIFQRIFLECVMVFFNMERYLSQIVRAGEKEEIKKE